MGDDDKHAGKQHISVCTVGHIDSGKSTTCGRLIFDLGGISEREMEKLQKKADELGKGSFAFAFHMDTQKEEQARGITISCKTRDFYTDNYHYTIVDCPGHHSFVRNMISGSSQVDVGIIMVPADGNFAATIAKGNHKAGEIQGQTRQHARILNLLGVKQIIVLVNKMDEKTANYSQERFEEVRNEMRDMMVKVGYKKDYVLASVPMIPISAMSGDNIRKPSDKMPWWKGQEVTKLDGSKVTVTNIEDALTNFVCPPTRVLDAPVRVPINGVYNIKGAGNVICGRVEQGKLTPKDEVIFVPTHTASNACTGSIFSIEMHHKSVPEAGPGDNVGLNIKGLDKLNMPKVGDVLVLKKDQSLRGIKSFTCQVQILDHPGELKKGYCPIACVRTAHSAVRLASINWKVGKETGMKKLEDPASLKANEMAEVEFEPQQPFVVDTFKNCEGLGRVAIFEGNSVVMLGKVTAITLREDVKK